MFNLKYLKKETFKDRLIYLCMLDMSNTDTSTLMVHGFKGFKNFTDDELIESIIDRYELSNEDEVVELTSLVAKMSDASLLAHIAEHYISGL